MRVRTGRGTPHPAPGVRHPAACHAARLPRIRRFPPPDATCRGEAASGKRPPRGNPEVRGGGLGPLPSRVLPPLPAHADRGRDRAGSDRAAAIRGLGGTWFPPDQFLPLFHRNGRGGWGVRAAQPTRPRGARAASERTPPLGSGRGERGSNLLGGGPSPPPDPRVAAARRLPNRNLPMSAHAVGEGEPRSPRTPGLSRSGGFPGGVSPCQPRRQGGWGRPSPEDDGRVLLRQHADHRRLAAVRRVECLPERVGDLRGDEVAEVARARQGAVPQAVEDAAVEERRALGVG